MDLCGRLWTPVDTKACRFGLCGRLWTPMDTACRSTDQEVGGSSPSGCTGLCALHKDLAVLAAPNCTCGERSSSVGCAKLHMRREIQQCWLRQTAHAARDPAVLAAPNCTCGERSATAHAARSGGLRQTAHAARDPAVLAAPNCTCGERSSSVGCAKLHMRQRSSSVGCAKLHMRREIQQCWLRQTAHAVRDCSRPTDAMTVFV